MGWCLFPELAASCHAPHHADLQGLRCEAIWCNSDSIFWEGEGAVLVCSIHQVAFLKALGLASSQEAVIHSSVRRRDLAGIFVELNVSFCLPVGCHQNMSERPCSLPGLS